MDPTAREDLGSVTPDAVIDFWSRAGPKAWFRRDLGFDLIVRRRFGAAHRAAAARQLDRWGDTPDGALALLLLLDQFSRHIHRGTAEAFASDPLARATAEQALLQAFDLLAPLRLQPFLYLPFKHHEDRKSQARSVLLFERHAGRSGEAQDLRSARRHADIIARFGRFPHRNALLGRPSTQDELDYLAHGGFRG